MTNEGKDQGVRDSVNKFKFIGFEVATTDATVTDVITEAKIKSLNSHKIREIHLKTTADDAYLGLGTNASVISAGSGNVTENVVPVFQDTFFTLDDCKVDKLTVIRASGTDVTVKGYVVIR